MMIKLYDNRMNRASPHTMFALDAAEWPVNPDKMRTAKEILDELKARGVTQGEMAKVLRVQQPNVATLYNPGKNGKPRRLGYDEAIALIEKFNLEDDAGRASEAEALSAENLAPLLKLALDLAPSGHVSEQSLRALSVALAHGIGLLGDHASSPANGDLLEMAVRGALLRFREITAE